ncbi:Adenylate and Guanylate cyclase catalytic domain containing protein [Tritrichomonas foetus]|uniref:Adenylate and Guanylate cyclase catalytic domain containing protein n=1 Tax=Tritrichomonas foetus TaxID=1144522 RepID=A0A1J4K4L6_9EUKA|nr:Adenylate and Guanylate cyclase catalytic domain containing protein [Tritrichomonas foetus]|eukprot:OHT04622.1 Adenylate and Guanylate cyclase catalytic domain containing protein [Tritrichomonas foetus]
MKSSIKESINRISIPSYKMLRIVHLTLYFILFLIPFIVVSIYGPIFIDETTGSLEYLYELAKLRFTLFQGFGLMVHYAGENLNLTYGDDMEYPGLVVFPFMNYEQLSNTFDEIETSGESWGSTFDTADQLKFVNQDLANILMKVQPLKSYKIGDTAMNEVREKIFSSNFQLKLYSNPVYDENWNISTNNLSTIHYDTFIQNMSLIDAGAIFLAQFNEVFKSSTIPTDVFNQRYYAIPINNIRGMSDEISSATSLMLTYYTQLNLRIQMICKISIIAFITVVTLIYIIVCTAIIISMNHDKIAIYKCLTTIQKSVVSRVAESLKILRKDDSEDRSSRLHDEELSKQEENLLKLFSTSSDAGGSQSNDNSQTIALTCLLIVAHAAMVVYLILCFSAAGNQLDQTTPHIDHIYASYTYEFATVLLLHLLPGAVYPSVNYQSDGFDKNSILRVIDEWQTRSQEEFAMVKYGDKNNNAPSFGELGIDINSVVQSASCDNDFIANDFHDTYRCYSPEATLCVTQMLETQLASTYLYSKGHEMYAGNSLYLSHIWHMSMVHVFDQYFDPLFNEMNVLVIDSMNARLPFMNAVSYSVAAIVIIVIIIYLYEMDISEKKQKYALTLLLHCPGKVVLSNSNAIALLANNFSHSEIDFTNRDSDFYEYLVQDMPDSMIIMKVDGTIMSMNHSTERIYGINTEDYLSNSIVKFGEVFNDTNPFKELFESAEKKSFQRKDLKILRNGKDEVCIEMEFEAMAEWFFVVSRDITQNVMYDKLIQEEKAKSDQLLSSILPPRLVARVAAGEKDISFAVQSVTIVFMDIVSFTPWCGSLPAATVMKTLNMLFKEFDALTQIHTTMTKIKCIGDCYMAAGGIFMEVNQPAIHAKDVVEFGLDSIDSVLHVNEILDENLRIRVGVNTGGPIVAGVLGIEKPTFEILGPTINMAQQMEHHGVPMKVHISRAVYELIYGGNFKIQERGEIELKNGNTVTYVVERTKDK